MGIAEVSGNRGFGTSAFDAGEQPIGYFINQLDLILAPITRANIADSQHIFPVVAVMKRHTYKRMDIQGSMSIRISPRIGLGIADDDRFSLPRRPVKFRTDKLGELISTCQFQRIYTMPVVFHRYQLLRLINFGKHTL